MSTNTQETTPRRSVIDDGPVPKHQQLREILLGIVEDELRPGAHVPSERELSTRFGVSRATVRESIGQLVRDGRLTRVHGKGTFVAPARRIESRLHLASFTEDMRRRGLEATTTVLATASMLADRAVATSLGISERDPVARIERLRAAQGQPMALEVGWYPLDRLPGLLAQPLAGSLYELLAERYDARPDAGEQTIAADAAGPEHGAVLGIDAAAPVLVFHRIASAKGEPVEDVTSWYRADRYQLAMTLEPATSGG